MFEDNEPTLFRFDFHRRKQNEWSRVSLRRWFNLVWILVVVLFVSWSFLWEITNYFVEFGKMSDIKAIWIINLLVLSLLFTRLDCGIGSTWLVDGMARFVATIGRGGAFDAVCSNFGAAFWLFAFWPFFSLSAGIVRLRKIANFISWNMGKWRTLKPFELLTYW